MQHISFQRLYNRIKTTFKTSRKAILVSLMLSLAFLVHAVPVFAQTPTTPDYSAYTNLFNGPDPVSSLKLNSLVKPIPGSATAVQPDIKFQFQSSFNLKIGGSEPKDWHWNHIRDFSNSEYVFIVRICDTSTTDESGCLFSKVPYRTNFKNDPDAPLVCANGLCKPPDPLPKIYHYADGGSLQNDKFNVLFSVNELATLKDGGLNDPIKINETFVIGSPTVYRADIWYCGGQNEGEPIPSADSGTDIRMFKNLCGDNRPYFKIATSADFKMPQTAVEAYNQTPATIEQANTTPTHVTDGLPDCGIGSLMGCVARIVYYLIYWPIAWFASLLGNLFDFFMGYSLDDASYRAQFAVQGWKLVRDISNIFFILILVWTGLETVFKTSSNNIKKVVPTLLMNAILINFSLFGTRVIIDISNVVARVFYNTMTVCEGECKADYSNVKQGPGGYKPISEAILSSFDPQRIFDAKVLDSSKASVNSATAGANTQADGPAQTAGYFIIVTLIGAAIVFGIAMMFWKTAFFFLGRVIGLYMTMIFAPFAVLTRGGMPLVGGITELSWKNWTSELIKYATLAPIFIFFLYVIYSVLNSDFLKVYKTNIGHTFFETVIYIAIPMLIVYFLIQEGVGIAKNYSGKIGTKIQEYSQKAVGIAGGVALGATAIGGARVLGGFAKKLDESKFGGGIRNMAAKGGLSGMIGKNLQKGINATRGGSFDLRQTGLGKSLFKEMGVDTDSKALGTVNKALNVLTLGATTGLGLSTAERKGGFDADVKRRQEDNEKESKLLEEKMSDEQIKKYNEKRREKYDKKIDDIIDQDIASRLGMTMKETKEWKKNNQATYLTERTTSLGNTAIKTQVDAVPPATEIKSAAELTSARRKTFADNLKKGGLFTQAMEGMASTGAFGEGVAGVLGSTIGAAIGSQIRTDGDRKAAKKIEEKTKVEKELAEIEGTLKKGFQDLIALDMFQNSPSFANNITATERQEIVKYGTIQSGTNKGKGVYDILTASEKAIVDADVKQKKDSMTKGTDDEKKKAKEAYEELEDLVKAREGNKFDLKILRSELKLAKDAWILNPGDPIRKAAFSDKLKEVKIAEKHQDKWRDINAYMKTRRDKLKEEEKK